MKKPKTDRFDPNQQSKSIKPEEVDLAGVPEIKHRKKKEEASPPPEQPAPQKQAEAAKQTSKHESNHASTLARTHDGMLESVRKTVKEVGKEIVYVRLTPAEKRRLEDLVYSYKRQGIKTSENEIARIALAFLLEEHSEDGKESTLAKVIALLNA